MHHENIVIVIPAYNEEKTIGAVIDDAKKITDKIIVVDDASSDRTGEIASFKGAKVYHHLINLGLGGALRTGFAAVLKAKPRGELGSTTGDEVRPKVGLRPWVGETEIVVTMDADGQHETGDIWQMIEAVRKGGTEVVIGSRLKKQKKGIPLSRLLFNYLANLVTFFFYGLMVSDSQSGLRAFRRESLEKIKLKSLHMEVSSEIIGEIKRNNLIFKEVPIKAIYTDYSLSKGQNFWLGVKTFFRTLIDRLT